MSECFFHVLFITNILGKAGISSNPQNYNSLKTGCNYLDQTWVEGPNVLVPISRKTPVRELSVNKTNISHGRKYLS